MIVLILFGYIFGVFAPLITQDIALLLTSQSQEGRETFRRKHGLCENITGQHHHKETEQQDPLPDDE